MIISFSLFAGFYAKIAFSIIRWLNTFGCNFFANSIKSKNRVSNTCFACPSLNFFSFPQSFSLFPAIEKLLQGGEPSKISRLYNSFGKSFLSLKVCIGVSLFLIGQASGLERTVSGDLNLMIVKLVWENLKWLSLQSKTI